MTNQLTERVIVLAMRDLCGADSPAYLDAAEFDRRVAACMDGLPQWPVVISTRGPDAVAACLFDQPVGAFSGQVARYNLIGVTRKRGKYGKAGLGFWARRQGSTVAEASHHELYSQALEAAYVS
jgi:hypothetical protein